MAMCHQHHKELVDGVGKCSVPGFMGGVPAGFCDEPAYGEPTKEGRQRYGGYVPFLACPDHGGPQQKRIVKHSQHKDGSQYWQQGSILDSDYIGVSVCPLEPPENKTRCFNEVFFQDGGGYGGGGIKCTLGEWASKTGNGKRILNLVIFHMGTETLTQIDKLIIRFLKASDVK